MTNKNELLKEAMDTISSLMERVSTLEQTNEELKSINVNLKDRMDRDKLAAELEIRGVVGYEKIAAVKDGTISEVELEELRNIVKLNPYSSNYYRAEETRITEPEQIKTASDAGDYRRTYRASYLLEELKQLNNQY